VSKTTETKVWNLPQLVRLGTIGDVAAATSAACQTANGGGSCNGGSFLPS